MAEKLPTGVTIRKHKSGRGSVYISFNYKGIQCRECLKGCIPNTSGIKHAENMRTEILNRIVTDRFVYSDYFPDSVTKTAKRFGVHNHPTTIAELFKSANWEDIAPKLTTAYVYKRDSKYTCKALGNIRVTDLTVRDIRDWVKTMPDLKRKTISNRLTPLRAVLALAVDDGIIDESPADKVNLGKQTKGLISHEQRKSSQTIDPFTEEEIRKILTSAVQLSPQCRNYFQCAFFAGLRHSELAGLKWLDEEGMPNIDLENRLLHINEALVSIGGKAYRQSPKTHNGVRTVNLVPMAGQALANQADITYSKSEYVFTRLDDKPGPIVHNDHYHKPWGKIFKMAGVRYRPPKQTRHTYASQLLSGGENIMYIAKQMGHADATMILSRYGKWVTNSQSSIHKPVSSYGQDD